MNTLGIDLHKRTSVWILIDGQKTELWKEHVFCHPAHISTAISKIPVPLKEISAAIEPVCGWRWVTKQLEEAGMDVHIAHPRKVQLIAQSTKKMMRKMPEHLQIFCKADTFQKHIKLRKKYTS